MRNGIRFLPRVRFGTKAVLGSLIVLFLAAALTLGYLWLRRSSFSCSGNFDFAVIGGEIIDGLGGAPFRADLGIRDKHIVCIGTVDPKQATQVIDATGLTVAPGFIDVHTHVERNVPARSEPFVASNFVRQGVTTIITGNCGRSFLDLGKAFRQLETNGTQVNVASFVGHNTIRQHVMSDNVGPPSADQQGKMKTIVAAAMRDGALGLSTGLEYIPGTFATTDEIVELAKVVRDSDGIYVSHIRDEGSNGLAAISEAISIGERAGIHVHISHFKAQGPNQWGSAEARLNLVKAGREKGLLISLDQYPYTASSTTIAVLLPSWVSSGGAATAKERLNNAATRAQVRAQMLEQLRVGGWKDYSFARVSYYGFDRSLVGLSIPEITRSREAAAPNRNEGKSINASFDSASPNTRENELERQADTVIDLFSHGDAQMVFFNMSEDDVETIMRNPEVMFGSDSGVREESAEARPHPRGLGTFPRILGVYGREKQLFSIQEAVRRMTSLPAETFGLRQRGQIREGFYADLVVFDKNRIIDTATYERPLSSPEGIYYVLVNGSIVFNGRGFTKSFPGMVLRRGCSPEQRCK
jgi:N-acyl-D-amino-acid deacylase